MLMNAWLSSNALSPDKGLGAFEPKAKKASKGGGPSLWLCQRRGREWPSPFRRQSSPPYRSEAGKGASRRWLEVGAALSFSFKRVQVASCRRRTRLSALFLLQSQPPQFVSFWDARPALACQFGLPPRQDSGPPPRETGILGAGPFGTYLALLWVEIILGTGSDSTPSSGRSGGPNKITLLTSEGPPPPGGPYLVRRADLLLRSIVPRSRPQGSQIPRCKWGDFGDGCATPKEKKLWMKREGHSLPLRWQSQTEGPPPLDAFFAFGSKAPNPLSDERALELNHVFINIWGLRSGFIAGLGPTRSAGAEAPVQAS